MRIQAEMSEPPRDQTAQSVDVAQALRVLRDRKWVIIGLTLLGLAGALVLSMHTTPRYQATARILRQNTTLDQAIFGAQIFQINDQERALITGADLVRLDQVAQKVKEELGSSRSVESLRNMVKALPNSTANIIDVVATSTDPVEPAGVANSFARQFIVYRQQADRTVLSNARAQVEAEHQLEARLSVRRWKNLPFLSPCRQADMSWWKPREHRP
jgi:capsular polysaccharide biosynthesis protein